MSIAIQVRNAASAKQAAKRIEQINQSLIAAKENLLKSLEGLDGTAGFSVMEKNVAGALALIYHNGVLIGPIDVVRDLCIDNAESDFLTYKFWSSATHEATLKSFTICESDFKRFEKLVAERLETYL